MSRPSPALSSDKTRALLAYLVVEADRPHRRDALTALLWPDQEDSAARQNLRQALYVLRHALGDGHGPVSPSTAPSPAISEDTPGDGGTSGPLLVTRQTVQINPRIDLSCDVRMFNELLAACKAHKHTAPNFPDPARCSECVERWRAAAALYAGDFLQGFVVNAGREFEEWMLVEREAHHHQVMHTLGRLADYYEAVGEHEQSLRFVQWQLKLEPWREEAHRQAMRLLSRTGQRSTALAQYKACRKALAEELGLEPSRETTALHERIRDTDTEHYVIPAVVGSVFLPIAATPLIGREAEVTSVVERLLRDDVRLLTITGPGGVGKTRIALQAAADLRERFTDGAYFVNLAPLTDPNLVAVEIAATLGLAVTPNRPAEEGLIAHLRGKRVLVLLDNFEHLASAAPLLAHLVKSTPHVKLLVTSRVGLGLRGTLEFSVSPMSLPARNHLPALERLSGYEAIRLFVDRATALQPDFRIDAGNAAAIVEICHRLDGLPLAIELAAARIKVLSPRAMLARMDSRLQLLAGKDRDVPARQQTLRNTIDWSYNLLDGAERALFQQIAVFQGGRTLHAIQAVCAGTGTRWPAGTTAVPRPALAAGPEVDLLDSVEALVSKSLLQQMVREDDREPRFWMLETIHEYAREKLRESGVEADLRRRHARYFADLVQQIAPHLKQEEQAHWLEQLEAEVDNIRAVFQWAREVGEAGDDEAGEIGLRLAVELERFWHVRVYLREGLEHTVGVLATGRPGGALRAKALRVAATLADACGDYAGALGLLEESAAIWRALGDTREIADTLHDLGNVHYARADYVRARAFYEEALRFEEPRADRHKSLHNLGLVHYEQGDLVAAEALLEELLALDRQAGDLRLVALSLANLGLIACERGDYALALARHQVSLAIRRDLRAKLGIAYSFEGLAMVYRGLGRAEMGARLWGAAEAMRETIGAPTPPNEHTRYRREQDALRAQLGDVAFRRAWAAGCALPSEQVVDAVLAEPAEGARLDEPA